MSSSNSNVVRIYGIARRQRATGEAPKTEDMQALLRRARDQAPAAVVAWLSALEPSVAEGIVKILEAGAGGGESNAPPKAPAKDDDAATARAKARMSAREVRLCAEKKIDPAKYAATRDAIRARSHRSVGNR